MSFEPVHPLTEKPLPIIRLSAAGTCPPDYVAHVRTTAPLIVYAAPNPAQGNACIFLDALGLAATNPYTVSGNGFLIDGAVSVTIEDPRRVFTIVFDGAQWTAVDSKARQNDSAAFEPAVGGSGRDASEVSYTPSDPADWTPDPSTVEGALDQLADRGSVLVWGNASIGTTATPRFLTPGYDAVTAPTASVDVPLPRAGVIRRLQLRARLPGTTGAQNVIYELRLNNGATALQFTVAATAMTGANLVDAVTVAAGDFVSVRVTKPGGIATSPTDVEVTAEFQPH